MAKLYPSLDGLMEDSTDGACPSDGPSRPAEGRRVSDAALLQPPNPHRTRSRSCGEAIVRAGLGATQVSPSKKAMNPAVTRKPSHQTCLHDIVKKENWESLLNTLSVAQGTHDVNTKDSDGNTALHIAVTENKKLDCVKVLLAFGADLSQVNHAGLRPDELKPKKKEVGDYVGAFRLTRPLASERTVDKSDSKMGIYAKPGRRILFLDGGGIRGLAQIEMLMEMERITGKKIVDLFDWFVGTSTGGIIALALVYCGMSLAQLKSYYLEMKTKVFAGKFAKVFNIESKTKAMEDLLKKMFGIQTLSSRKHPRVMIAVVNTYGDPTLQFFNNFMDEAMDDTSRWLREAPVWQAARATSAAPMHFLAFRDYIDGGIMANNPSMKAWSEVLRYCQATRQPKPKVSIAVSLGSGVVLDAKLEEKDINMLGRSYLNVPQAMKRVKNFFEMLQKALTESQSVAVDFSTLCQSEDIPFFRFSPEFSNYVTSGERNDKKILDMMVGTRSYYEKRDVEAKLVRMSQVLRFLDHLKDKYEGRVPL